MSKSIFLTDAKRRQINGVHYISAIHCLRLLGTDYAGLRRIAARCKWRQFQLPTSPNVFYAEDDVLAVDNQSCSMAGEKK